VLDRINKMDKISRKGQGLSESPVLLILSKDLSAEFARRRAPGRIRVCFCRSLALLASHERDRHQGRF